LWLKDEPNSIGIGLFCSIHAMAESDSSYNKRTTCHKDFLFLHREVRGEFSFPDLWTDRATRKQSCDQFSWDNFCIPVIQEKSARRRRYAANPVASTIWEV